MVREGGDVHEYISCHLSSTICIITVMPRQSRIDAPGALHHVIIRGIERKAIFKDDTDRTEFIERIASIFADSSTPCFAWALMSNHAPIDPQCAVLSGRKGTGYNGHPDGPYLSLVNSLCFDILWYNFLCFHKVICCVQIADFGCLARQERC